DKGVYTETYVREKLGEFIEFKFTAGLTLQAITLPEYFAWQYQLAENVNEQTTGNYYILKRDGTYQAVSLPTDYVEGMDYYSKDVDLSKIVIAEGYEFYSDIFVVSYNENPENYETFTNLEIEVRIIRGDLKPASFEHTPITVTYTDNLTVGKIAIMTAGYTWYTEQENYNKILVANGEDGEVFYMNYIPKYDNKFVESIYGSKYNYNNMIVEVKVFVKRASFERSTVLRALGSYTIAPRAYKPGLTIADLNIALPDGFVFADTSKSLIYGVNECAIIYNYNSEYNANYNSYGESLTEQLTININIISPMLKGYLDPNSANVALDGESFKAVWDEKLNINSPDNIVPYILEYYDEDLSTWIQVAGTATWLNGDEEVTNVGYTTKQIMFVANNKNFTEGNEYGIFDVKVLVSGADPLINTLNFKDEKDDLKLIYANIPTLKRMSRVTSSNSKLQYLDDITYTYRKVHRSSDPNEEPQYYPEMPLTSETVLSASDGGEYLIIAHFSEGMCYYYDFGEEPFIMTKTLVIGKAELNISLNNVTRTYGDLIINNDPKLKANGIESLSENDYSLAVYSDEDMIVEVDLNYTTDAGIYYIILTLEPYLSDNYIYGDSLIFKSTYEIKKKEIKEFGLVHQLLREDGSNL
ncbi:MAG: hypothetical protein IKA31_05055, partial [Clostridia bacterium]|nr:hypothetical protein [Clostridia bacterium]